VVRALFPGEYDVGARLAGRWGFVGYALAVQNGEPAGEKPYALRDPDQGRRRRRSNRALGSRAR
jgi:hypothetical protein